SSSKEKYNVLRRGCRGGWDRDGERAPCPASPIEYAIPRPAARRERRTKKGRQREFGLLAPSTGFVAAGNHGVPGLLEIKGLSRYVGQVSPGAMPLSVKAMPCPERHGVWVGKRPPKSRQRAGVRSQHRRWSRSRSFK